MDESREALQSGRLADYEALHRRIVDEPPPTRRGCRPPVTSRCWAAPAAASSAKNACPAAPMSPCPPASNNRSTIISAPSTRHDPPALENPANLSDQSDLSDRGFAAPVHGRGHGRRAQGQECRVGGAQARPIGCALHAGDRAGHSRRGLGNPVAGFRRRPARHARCDVVRTGRQGNRARPGLARRRALVAGAGGIDARRPARRRPSISAATQSRRLHSWTAKRSLLLETRRLPAGANVTTFGAWQEAWKKSPAVDGAAFVPLIFHGDNPFGRIRPFPQPLHRPGENRRWRRDAVLHSIRRCFLCDHRRRSVLKWQKNQPPPLDPAKVPFATVRVPKGLGESRILPCGGRSAGAMVLGWEQGGKLGNVPPEAWVHPGKVKAGSVRIR